MHKSYLSITLMILTVLIIYSNRDSEKIGTIALHVGKAYKDVLRDSTFPVKSETAIRATTPPVEDSTWITRPAIVKFDDPKHGFTLPPTKFGAIGYNRGRVTTITTSPMLETLPFDQLILLINNLQLMLKNAGWTPRDEYHAWFNLETEIEKHALQNLLFKQVIVMTLLIPHQYSMSFNVKCYARCDEYDPKTAKYLIDISIGQDFYTR